MTTYVRGTCDSFSIPHPKCAACVNWQPLSKKPWVTPKIEIVPINAAQGHTPGPLCDKHGSLSGACE